MSRPPPESTLLAVTPFSAGDVGWLTPIGVVRRPPDSPPRDDVALVRAVEDIQPGKHGRFLEISPETP